MGLEPLKTTWNMLRHAGPDQKVVSFPVAVLQIFDATAISCSTLAAQPTKGCLVLRRPQLMRPILFRAWRLWLCLRVCSGRTPAQSVNV